jgi:hypothetical protein
LRRYKRLLYSNKRLLYSNKCLLSLTFYRNFIVFYLFTDTNNANQANNMVFYLPTVLPYNFFRLRFV